MLEVKNLTKIYAGRPVLKDISFSVGEHEIVALVGPSGCGKSTLLNLIAGINGNYEGNIENRAGKTGYIFQEDRILPWLSVYDNIKVVRKKEDRKRILELIGKMHLSGFEQYYPEQLSGGMRQRCGIARAFYYGSRLLLMDEPFKSLDMNLRLEMLRILLELWETEEGSVIFVTHDIEEALMIADRILVLKGCPAVLAEEIILPERKNLRDPSEEALRKARKKLLQWMEVKKKAIVRMAG